MYGKVATRTRWAGYGRHVREEKWIWGFVRRHEGKRPLGRHRCRWKNNIKMYDKKVGWQNMDCIILAQDRDKCLFF